eukprot:gene16326-biopygen8438
MPPPTGGNKDRPHLKEGARPVPACLPTRKRPALPQRPASWRASRFSCTSVVEVGNSSAAGKREQPSGVRAFGPTFPRTQQDPVQRYCDAACNRLLPPIVGIRPVPDLSRWTPWQTSRLADFWRTSGGLLADSRGLLARLWRTLADFAGLLADWRRTGGLLADRPSAGGLWRTGGLSGGLPADSLAD